MKLITITLCSIALLLCRVEGSASLYPVQLSQYAGQVTTVPGFTEQASAVTYDSVHHVFYGWALGEIFKITLSGKISNVAHVPATSIGGLVYDPNDNLIYATNPYAYAVWQVSLSGQKALLAGGKPGTADGQGSAAKFRFPTGIALDPSAQLLYVADFDRIRTVSISGNVTTLTAPGTIGEYGANERVTVGLAFDPSSGLIYVADWTRNKVESIDASGHLHVVAGKCVNSHNKACQPLQIDGTLQRAGFASPCGVVVDPADGSLFILENGNNDIRHVTATGVTTLAGSGDEGSGDGAGELASFWSPIGVAINPSNGVMLVADSLNYALRVVTSQGKTPPPHRTERSCTIRRAI